MRDRGGRVESRLYFIVQEKEQLGLLPPRLLSTLRILTPVHKNHQLCTEEIFQGIDTLRNRTVPDDDVEKLFQNLSLLKEYIDLQKKKCGEERRKIKQFLDYLQEFLGVISTDWT
ncbi:interleukin-5 isoform X1 [Trichechus manatus latirostris]|uniref:Interleukin-5 n=1 Tax=Trichechus manatus latirostris TaxID=127582 RepID=A0A2Y9RT17_TRIMA|nr:interleukin-5 isoform X1 [Trichechus manatus latirostris]